MSNLRGQSYDNGENMKGQHNGVQVRWLNMNDKAINVCSVCCSHFKPRAVPDLVICDSAKSSVQAITFFGILSRLYVLFSSSPARWKILKDNMDISIKQQSDTRWELRI